MNCRVFYHDRCFDGACSAALFTLFHSECIRTADRFEYQGLVHRAGSLMEEGWFSASGENAIVDFKYSPSPQLTWWFDHHLSAFPTAEDERQFQTGQRNADGSPGPFAMRHFFDPDYISCTGFIAHIASTRFGMDLAPLANLIHWANIVDGARYESAEAAVGMREAAMKLTLVIESGSDASGHSITRQIIPLLTEMSLEQVLEQPFVTAQLAPLLERHWQAMEIIRARAQLERGVITFDITDQPTEGYSKFIPYFLYPEANYTVGLSRSSFRNKVSVGTNPWSTMPAEALANIATICERYGGGGHARVGAISFPVEQIDDARLASAQIAKHLRDLDV